MRFVTLFPKGSNVHLIKDVGQIPYTLAKKFNIDAVLVSNHINMQGPYIGDVLGLQYDKVKYKWLGWRIGTCLYILLNAKKIDWLNIYHVGKRSWYWTKIYKFVNHKGKVYLKLDMDFQSCDKLNNSLKMQKIFNKCLNVVDLVSVESAAVQKRIQPHIKKELLLIPNGYMLADKQLKSHKKENIFLTVGRLGTKQKATEILLEAFSMCAEKQSWELRLIGSVEESFKPYIENYFCLHPELRERVKFMGVVTDRAMLAEQYRRAKIFVLPSRWEGFSLVLSEAASQGCKLIITSAIPCCEDLVPKPEFGKIIPPNDPYALANAMKEMIDLYKDSNDASIISAYAKENFSWEKICEKIYSYLCNETTITNPR